MPTYGLSGKWFGRPAFQKMIQDILAGKINCITVKDLSRLGRDYITIDYYIDPAHRADLYL